MELFGLHFATLDIRQDSSIHGKVLSDIAAHSDALPENYIDLSQEEKINALTGISKTIDPADFDDVLVRIPCKLLLPLKASSISMVNWVAAGIL